MNRYEDQAPKNEKALSFVKPEVPRIQEASGEVEVTPEKLAEYSRTVVAQVDSVREKTDKELTQGEAVFGLDAGTVEAVRTETGVQGKLQLNWDALANLKCNTQDKLINVVTSKGFSEGVDWVPVAGSAKMVGESVAGKRLSGEEIIGMDRMKHGAKGAAFLAADLTGVGEVARLGKAGIVAAKIGEAAAVKALGKQMVKEGGKLHARGKERVVRGKKLGETSTKTAERREAPQGENYEVPMGEWKRVEYPDKAETGVLGPCHGIGILNRKKGLGYLGHFLNDTNAGEDLINQAIQESESIRDLHIALAGNTPLSRADVEDIGENYEMSLASYKNHAKWLLDLLQSKGFHVTQIQNYLVDQPSEDSYAMEVDTKTRKITVRKERDE